VNRRWFRPIIVLVLIYAPFGWLLWTSESNSDYWWHWVSAWPVLPGMPALLLVRPLGMESHWQEILAMGIPTAVLIAASMLITRRGWCWAIGVFVVLTVYGVFIGLASRSVFLA
jgi:hypothetical protein